MPFDGAFVGNADGIADGDAVGGAVGAGDGGGVTTLNLWEKKSLALHLKFELFGFPTINPSMRCSATNLLLGIPGTLFLQGKRVLWTVNFLLIPGLRGFPS